MFARRALIGGITAPRSTFALRHTSSGCCSSSNAALLCNKRAASQLVANLAAHSVQVSSCASLGTLLYSPLGTAMLILLAYNVVVIGTKQLIYTMEITGKDYVQDQQLHVIMKYGILCCALLAMEALFVEV